MSGANKVPVNTLRGCTLGGPKILLVSLLYDLMRDHVPPGVIEGIVQRDRKAVEKTYPTFEKGFPLYRVNFSNGHLARYAQELAARLLPPE